METINSFIEAFKENEIDLIVSKVETLIKDTRGMNKNFYENKFATHLFLLGILLQNDDYITQSNLIISNASLEDKADIFSKIANFFLLNEKKEMGYRGKEYVEMAFKAWVEYSISRRRKKARMSSFDYFNHDLRILGTLKNSKSVKMISKWKEIAFEFIKTCPKNMQPLLIAALADAMINYEDEVKIVSYLQIADKIVNDSSTSNEKSGKQHLKRTPDSFLGPFGPLATLRPDQLEKSPFDFQIALARATEDTSRLKVILESFDEMEMMRLPVFSALPKMKVARVYYDIDDRTSATGTATGILTDITREWEENGNQIPSENPFFSLITVHLAELLITINEKELARKLLPLMKGETQADSRLTLLNNTNKRSIMIELDGYTKENLLEDLQKLEENISKFENDDKQEKATSQRLPFPSSVPPEISILRELAELQFCAEKLDAPDVKEYLNNMNEMLKTKLMESSIDKLPTPSSGELSRSTHKHVTPNEIRKAYSNSEHEKVESMIKEYRDYINSQIEILTKQQSKSSQIHKHPLGVPHYNKEVMRFLILTELVGLYIDIEKYAEAKDIIDEIQEYFDTNTTLLQQAMKNTHPPVPIIQLFRKMISLKINIGGTNEDISEIILKVKKYDSEGLVTLGVLLAEKGNSEMALTIEAMISKQSQRDLSSWSQYFERRSRVLLKLGFSETVKSYIESEPDFFQKSNIDQALFIGDKILIQQIIDDFAKNYPSRNIASPDPLRKVDSLLRLDNRYKFQAEILEFAQECLKVKLVKIVSGFDPNSGSIIPFRDLKSFLLYLVSIGEDNLVRTISERIILTLQEAVMKYAPNDLKQKVKVVDLDGPSWDIDTLIKSTLSRSNIHFTQTRDDFWEYYKIYGNKGKIGYGDFESVYEHWSGYHLKGEESYAPLYIHIPYVYDSMIGVFQYLSDEKLSTLCKENREIFRNTRINLVEKYAPNADGFSGWLGNTLNLVKLEMHDLLKKQKYSQAKKNFDSSLELLDQKGKKRSRSDGLSLDPLLMSILDMIELLTKY